MPCVAPPRLHLCITVHWFASRYFQFSFSSVAALRLFRAYKWRRVPASLSARRSCDSASHGARRKGPGRCRPLAQRRPPAVMPWPPDCRNLARRQSLKSKWGINCAVSLRSSRILGLMSIGMGTRSEQRLFSRRRCLQGHTVWCSEIRTSRRRKRLWLRYRRAARSKEDWRFRGWVRSTGPSIVWLVPICS